MSCGTLATYAVSVVARRLKAVGRWFLGIPLLSGPEFRSHMLIDFIAEGDLSEHARFRRWSCGRLIPTIPDWGSPSVIYGGYLGDSSAAVLQAGESQLHVYEPFPPFVSTLRKRFEGDERVTVHEYAVAGREAFVAMTDALDATSVGTGEVRVAAKAASETLKEFESVFFLEMNIEGSEYEVLEELISTGAISKVKHLWIQFHNFHADDELRRAEIRRKLRATHECRVSFTFVWEWWTIGQGVC